MSYEIWQPEFECLPREEMQALQLTRLKETLARLCENVPFYRDRLKEAGVSPDSIRTLDDVRRIPFTTKADLRQHYPYGLLSVPLKNVARIHASTGTTGQPTVVAYTRRDLETWADLVARFVVAAGVRPDDLVHIAFSYGLFTGGFGLHYGIERMGAGIIPVAAGNTERQVRILKEMRPTALVCTPSYSLHIAEVMESMGITPEDIALRIGLFGGEFWSESLRREIEIRLGIGATDNYGLSEVIGPGVSGECVVKNGMHLQEDHFLIEHIDPETERPVAPGEVGELVITPLSREAFSVLRYRTRDLCTLIDEPCSCGRTTRRMTKVIGRTDDMLIVRGVNLFPSQVETVLLDMGGAEPHYQIVVGRSGTLDEMEIQVEMPPELFSDEMKELHQFERNLEKRLQGELGVSFKLTLVEPRTLERSMGKAKRVVDLRGEQQKTT
ncbi:phenylacetate--CoA ligase [Candidatus Sumerlaeota bacterium]|nr:phenylacetate--CoA ligase [Candidatus Sumerlaeota bacterium]